MNELTLLDGGEDDARIRGIYAENENWERIEICEPIYDDEDGHRYEMKIINENNYHGNDRKRGWLKCRFDSDKVGHYSVNVLHSRHGRARMPRNGNHCLKIGLLEFESNEFFSSFRKRQEIKSC